MSYAQGNTRPDFFFWHPLIEKGSPKARRLTAWSRFLLLGHLALLLSFVYLELWVLIYLISFIYWNMNFHTEHHMYAGVPFYNLPALRREIGWDLQQRIDPEYRYIPEFPPGATRPRRDD